MNFAPKQPAAMTPRPRTAPGSCVGPTRRGWLACGDTCSSTAWFSVDELESGVVCGVP